MYSSNPRRLNAPIQANEVKNMPIMKNKKENILKLGNFLNNNDVGKKNVVKGTIVIPAIHGKILQLKVSLSTTDIVNAVR